MISSVLQVTAPVNRKYSRLFEGITLVMFIWKIIDKKKIALLLSMLRNIYIGSN